MEYQIIDFIETTAQVVIKYADLPPFAIDLPIDDDGNVPSGSELTNYIVGFIPVWHTERKLKLEKGIKNAQEIANLVIKLPQVTPTDEEIKALKEIKDAEEQEFRRRVTVILFEEGLIK